MEIGYHASHEQFAPSTLLELTLLAENMGFRAASCSDHFHPWSKRQDHSGFAWSWLGAAVQATSLSFGLVCTPGYRYHPTIVAQAAATLAEMFPERIWVSLGSGELLNEGITGMKWPAKSERNEILYESVEVIRALLAGETVTHHGLIQVEEAKLFSLPLNPPIIFGAAITPETAEWVGEWADGLITISQPVEQLRQVVEAFHRGGGEGKPMHLKAQISYARTEEEARQGAWEQWRTNVFESSVLADLRTPDQFDAIGKFVRPEDLYEFVRISHKPEKHVEWIQKDFELGFTNVYLHNVNTGQRLFIEDFGRKVLPALGL